MASDMGRDERAIVVKDEREGVDLSAHGGASGFEWVHWRMSGSSRCRRSSSSKNGLGGGDGGVVGGDLTGPL